MVVCPYCDIVMIKKIKFEDDRTDLPEYERDSYDEYTCPICGHKESYY